MTVALIVFKLETKEELPLLLINCASAKSSLMSFWTAGEMVELFYDRTPSEYVSKRTGAKIVQVPIDVGAIPEAKDYFALITYILDQLVK